MGVRISIFLLWGIISLVSASEYRDIIAELSVKDRIIICIVFLIGGPIFAANQILTTILDIIFPAGWDDDFDDRGFM